eukprot:m.746128 g.746128  ORF g.746128 m.746128 type:complete len:60 (-) comp23132_c0_seq1:234-413(-)
MPTFVLQVRITTKQGTKPLLLRYPSMIEFRFCLHGVHLDADADCFDLLDDCVASSAVER